MVTLTFETINKYLMKTKHYRLIIATMMLAWVVSLPLMRRIETIYVPVVETKLDPITVSRNDVRAQLISVYEMEPARADWWAHHITYAAHAHDVPTNIIIGVISVESEFQTDVRSHKGAVGATQVVPSAWKKSLGYNIQDPIQNIYAGAYILNNYKTTCGDWDCALKAYNVGITNYLAGKAKPAQAKYLKKVKIELATLDEFTVRNALE